MGLSTFDFAAIDQGKIILTTMSQKFQTERRYVITFLKLLYCNTRSVASIKRKPIVQKMISSSFGLTKHSDS